MKIIMSQAEIALMQRFMEASDSYFEYGMGGSTCMASKKVRREIVAIDSDAAWVAKVRVEIGDLPEKRINLRHVDIGPTGEWGMPKAPEKGREEIFDSYSLAISQPGLPSFDLVLVDGRFRVACFLQAIKTQRSDTVFAIHDYTDRPHYHVVEEFARPICVCEQLVIFDRRQDLDSAALDVALQKYRRNPA